MLFQVGMQRVYIEAAWFDKLSSVNIIIVVLLSLAEISSELEHLQ